MRGKWHKRFYDLAVHVSAWSKDPSTKVGACVVNDDNQVLSLGFNGFHVESLISLKDMKTKRRSICSSRMLNVMH